MKKKKANPFIGKASNPICFLFRSLHQVQDVAEGVHLEARGGEFDPGAVSRDGRWRPRRTEGRKPYLSWRNLGALGVGLADQGLPLDRRLLHQVGGDEWAPAEPEDHKARTAHARV